MSGRVITRRSVVSRQREDREGLVRLVRAPDGLVLVDYRARLGGRGAWVEPEREAVELLEKRPGVLGKSLGTPIDPRGLLERVREANLKAVYDALSMAARAGVLMGGKDGVRGLISAGQAIGVLLASDASERLGQDLDVRSRELPVFRLDLGRDELGGRIGKGPRAALAVKASKPGEALITELQRRERLR